MDTVIKGSRPWDTPDTGVDSPYTELAHAIVLQAVWDYKKTLKAMWKNPKQAKRRLELSRIKLELEAFFYSQDYQMYCDIPPDKLIRLCRKTAVEEEKRVIMRKRKTRSKKKPP